jgi:hypothetical protein
MSNAWSPPSTWKQISETLDTPLSDRAIQLLDERDRSITLGGGGSNSSSYYEVQNFSPEKDDGDSATFGPFNAPPKTDPDATFFEATVLLAASSNVAHTTPINMSIRWFIKDSGGTVRAGNTSTEAFRYAPDSGGYVFQSTSMNAVDGSSLGDMQGCTLLLEYYADVSPTRIWETDVVVDLAWVYDGTP